MVCKTFQSKKYETEPLDTILGRIEKHAKPKLCIGGQSLALLDETEINVTKDSWAANPSGSIVHERQAVKITRNEVIWNDTPSSISINGEPCQASSFRLFEDIREIQRGNCNGFQSSREYQLGEGACGSVHLGIHEPTQEQVAVKRISLKTKEKRDQMLSDLRCLVKLKKSKNLVVFYAGFLKESGIVHIVMEFMDFGSLDDVFRLLLFRELKKEIRTIPESVVSNFFLQVLRGTKELHKHSIVHRDIKPGNILINKSGIVKLSDFGISRLVTPEEEVFTFCGTTIYMSPERLAGSGYSFSSDLWSVGLCALEFTIGKHPFKNQNFLQVLESSKHFNIDDWDLKEELEEFVKNCICPRENRMLPQELMELPFFPKRLYTKTVLKFVHNLFGEFYEETLRNLD